MGVQVTLDNGAAVIRLKANGVQGLLAAAVFLQAQHKRLLNVSNPRPYDTPSKPGEYPRKRTGQLQAGTLYYPRTPAQAAAEMRVAVGYSAQAFYGNILTDKGRLGLMDTVQKYLAQLGKIATSGKAGA